MKDLLSELKQNCQAIYCPDGLTGEQPYVLCAMPGLSVGGSQTVFAELLELIRQHSRYNFVIFSPDDGEYRDVFLKMKCIVCIRPDILDNFDFMETIKASFSRVILNSFLTHPYLLLFVNTDIPVFWWIHEPFEHIVTCCQTMPDPRLLSRNIHIYGVADHVDDAFWQLYKYHTKTMHIAVHDVHDEYTPKHTDDRVTFLMPAAYTNTKGQDILLMAISALPDEFRQKCSFQFCGYQVPGAEEYYNKIIDLSKRFDCVTHLGLLSKHELYQYYANCDCVIAPSRVDTGPATIVEGMMFHKLALVSDKTGISKYITDCVNGFVFHNEDDLIKRLLLIISDISALHKVAEKGNEIWKTHYSPESIEEILFSSGVF